jgi:hypothetical protein
MNMTSTDASIIDKECTPAKQFKSKAIAYIAIMSALGSVLAFISMLLVPLGPNVAVDLSHIGTYLVAIPGGPILGAIAGALVGIIPAFRFANALLIPGKIMTGFTVGLIAFLFKRLPKYKESKVLQVMAIPISGILGYITEYLFTVWDLSAMLGYPDVVILTIIIKAWIEIIVISFLMMAILSIPVISSNIKQLVGDDAKLGIKEYLLTGIIVSLAIFMLMAIFINTGFSWDYGFHEPSLLLSVFLGWLVAAGIIAGTLGIVLIVRLKRESCKPV